MTADEPPTGEQGPSLFDIFGPHRPAPNPPAPNPPAETGAPGIRAGIPSVMPASIGYRHFGMRPLHLGVFLGAFKADSREKVTALAATYDLTKEYLAPFMVKTAIDMLPDLRRAVARNPSARVVFVGRDAFCLGYVVSALDPDFYRRSCRSMYLSRSIVDAALRELEATTGADFAAIEHFRKRPAPETSPGAAWQALTTYFAENDIRLDTDDAEVLLVDTGYKGSVQEMLSAAYPRTRFRGHLVFFAASRRDPHPGSKRGYALHLDLDRGNDGLAIRGRLPDDVELTFAHLEAILAVEELLQGSALSPPALCPGGRPLTLRQRHEPRPLAGINPVLVAAEYRDPFLREGVFSMNVTAVSQYAHAVAPRIVASGPDWYRAPATADWYVELAERSVRLRDRIRAWVGRTDPDPAFARCLDAFVHRADKTVVTDLEAAVAAAGLSAADRDAVWRRYDRCATLDERRDFTTRLVTEPPAPAAGPAGSS